MSIAAVELYLQVSECGIVAAAALLVFDYCLTLGQELEWLYGTKWTAARIHFASLRYLPFLAIAMAIPTSRVQPSGTSYCGPLGMATNAVYYLCIVLAEVMLIVRTYAFWKCDRKILIGMCTLGVVCMLLSIIPSETIASKATNAVYKALNCVGVESTAATAVQYICLIIFEMGMLALNWIAFWRMKQYNPPGRLIMTLYCDGVVYVAVIMVFSMINAIVTLASPVQYSNILNSPQMVMHSILVSRLFFNLRETTRQEQVNMLPIALSEFCAAAQGSGGFSSSSGNSSSGNGINLDKVIDIRRGVDVPGESMIPG